jgi:hypothetical protein
MCQVQVEAGAKDKALQTQEDNGAEHQALPAQADAPEEQALLAQEDAVEDPPLQRQEDAPAASAAAEVRRTAVYGGRNWKTARGEAG